MLKIQLIGNVGLDSEIRQVNGKKAITFNVAENQSFTNGKGEKMKFQFRFQKKQESCIVLTTQLSIINGQLNLMKEIISSGLEQPC